MSGYLSLPFSVLHSLLFFFKLRNVRSQNALTCHFYPPADTPFLCTRTHTGTRSQMDSW